MEFEYSQAYEGQPGPEVPGAEATGSSRPGAPREARMDYRHEALERPAERRASYGSEPSRFGFGRPGAQRGRKGLLGLSNLGNTCFMNSALQCLTHTHGLQKYFRFCSHDLSSKSQSNRQKLVMSFAHWFERDWGRNVSAHYHSPEDILKYVQQLNPAFQGYAQQDSQEFLRCVLDNLHEELRREVPEDAHGHLLRCFGLEAPGEAAAGAGHPASADPLQRTGTEEEAGQLPGGYKRPGTAASAAPSATRQLMQLCQSTEGVTDVDEIRLPWKAAPQGPRADAPGAGAPAGARRPGEAAGEEAAAGEGSAGRGPGQGAEGTSAAPAAGAEERVEEEGAPATHFASIISELFQGRVVSVVRCLECQKTSRTQEVMYDVSVPIPNANELGGHGAGGGDLAPGLAQSQPASGLRGPTWSGMLTGIPGKVKGWFYDKGVEVTDCLRKYCAPELLGGKDKYYCEHCKRKNDCEKRIAFRELPEVLCIHIKRFRYDAGWFNGTKNSRLVTFPVNRPLDLSCFLEEPTQQPVEYRLIGLIQHIGSMGGGHYIAYCQHKRRPQEWYEFDDLQVSLVRPEQVERAEPYVLFYQRVPSKGSRLDRTTFKSDMRRVQAQVRQHLLAKNRVAPSPTGPGAGDAGEAAQQAAAQAVAEEMRHQGPALRGLYRSPPEELGIVFVTKHWYVRLTTMSQPGPLDNFEYLCPHQLLGADSAELAAEPFIPISRELFNSLRRKYGGGPAIEALEVCPRCQRHLRAYNERKQAEFDLVSKYDTKDTGDGRGWYLVDAAWVGRWKRYVRAEQVADVRDMCAPGPITNSRLLDRERPGAPRTGLRLRIDYIGVNARVWWLFMHVHGGGPTLCREELDVYSAEFSPETDLQLDELRGTGSADFALRVSRQFVDECHGDMSLYEHRYGGGSSSSSKEAGVAQKEDGDALGLHCNDPGGQATAEGQSSKPVKFEVEERECKPPLAEKVLEERFNSEEPHAHKQDDMPSAREA